MKNKIIDRRVFLKGAAGAVLGGVGLPDVVPSAALGKAGSVAPSSRITVGCIGLGNQGSGLMRGFLGKPDVQIVAVCDVHSTKREGTREAVEKHYAERQGKGAYKGCSAYNDFRDLVCRPDIDAVTVAPPDHWHVLISLAAARAGKDIRGQTISGIDAAVRVDTVCHLSDIATQLELRLTWDPKHERFTNNDTANRLLVRAMRSPWHL